MPPKGKKNVTSNRTKQVWTEGYRKTAIAKHSYIQVKEEKGDIVKKTNLQITGAERRWDDMPNFVYEPVSRLCGPKDLVRKVVKRNLSAILEAVEDDKRWKDVELKTVDDVMSQAYTAGNHEKNKGYQREKEKAKSLKETKSAKQKAGKSSGSFNIFDVPEILAAFPKAEREEAEERRGKEAKKGGKANTGIRAQLAKARKNNQILDVSSITGAVGAGCHRLDKDTKRKAGLKTAPGIENNIIWSKDKKHWVIAMSILEAPVSEGGAGYTWYKKFHNAWNNPDVTGEITSEQRKKEERGAGKAKKEKAKKKKEPEPEESEEEEEGTEEESEEEASVKPMKKRTTKPSKKEEAEEEESEEEEASEKKTSSPRERKSSEKTSSPRERKSASPREKKSAEKSEALPEPSAEAAEAVKEERASSPSRSVRKEEEASASEKAQVAPKRVRKTGRRVGSPRAGEKNE